MEPLSISGPRTTETAASEGRLKVDVGGPNKKKKLLKNILKQKKYDASTPKNADYAGSR